MSFLFEKLEVYQRAIDLAEKIDRLTEAFAGKGNYHLVDQLGRTSISISLNIAEGNGRWHVRIGGISFGLRAVPRLMRALGGTL